ncbi:MAG: CapA family protein [Gammaproteobacteria bacterium]|nr:MAG: CapA family protein [Gammaproteobacteria bacterium]
MQFLNRALIVVLALTASVAAQAQEPAVLKIAAVGDIMLGGTGTPEFERFGYDYPFDKTRALLKQSHIVFGNLEGPLTHTDHEAVAKKYRYRSAPEKVAPALLNAGFNVVSLANNHTMDQGAEGLRHTLEALDLVGIKHTGAGMNLAEARTPAILEANGVRVAFLAYTLTFPEEFWATAERPGSPFGHESQVRADIVAARQQADIVLVSFHWGQEGKTELRDYQKQLGRAAIDAGAAAVIGHHPHVLQGVERYKHGVILYSLGNFAFGTYGPEAFRSAVAVLTFREEWRRDAPITEPRMHKKLAELRLHPLNVRNAEVVFQPLPLVGAAADKVVAELQQISKPLGTQLENRDGVAVLTIDAAQEARR